MMQKPTTSSRLIKPDDSEDDPISIGHVRIPLKKVDKCTIFSANIGAEYEGGLSYDYVVRNEKLKNLTSINKRNILQYFLTKCEIKEKYIEEERVIIHYRSHIIHLNMFGTIYFNDSQKKYVIDPQAFLRLYLYLKKLRSE